MYVYVYIIYIYICIYIYIYNMYVYVYYIYMYVYVNYIYIYMYIYNMYVYVYIIYMYIIYIYIIYICIIYIYSVCVYLLWYTLCIYSDIHPRLMLVSNWWCPVLESLWVDHPTPLPPERACSKHSTSCQRPAFSQALMAELKEMRFLPPRTQRCNCELGTCTWWLI